MVIRLASNQETSNLKTCCKELKMFSRLSTVRWLLIFALPVQYHSVEVFR
jgi:hypothetical protein